MRRALAAVVAVLLIGALAPTAHAATPPAGARTGAVAAAAAGGGPYWEESHCQFSGPRQVCLRWLFSLQADGDGLRVFQISHSVSDCGDYAGDGSGTLNPMRSYSYRLNDSLGGIIDTWFPYGGADGCSGATFGILNGPDQNGMDVLTKVTLRLANGSRPVLTFNPSLCKGGPSVC